LREEEKLYERLLKKIEDRSSQDYKRIYRKLYYIRNRHEIKEYQKTYYQNRRAMKNHFEAPLTGNIKDGFNIKYEPIIINFE